MTGLFNGTVADEIIAPGLVSPTVTIDPGSSATPDIGSDTILGQGGDDTLIGGGGGDLLLGNFGDDVIDVRTGDTVAGLEDRDRFRVFTAGAGTSIDGGSGTDTLEPQGTLDLTDAILTGIEVLALDGSTLTLGMAQLAAFEELTTDGDATEGVLALVDGGTAVLALDGLERLTVSASDDADDLTFTTFFPPIAGVHVAAGGGDDVVTTGDGADSLDGEAGNDLLTAGDGADRLDGGAGDDTLLAATGDRVSGGGDDDVIRVASDLLDPGLLAGGTGDDTLVALTGFEIGADVVIQGIENLGLLLGTVSLGAAQLAAFDRVLGLALGQPASIVISRPAAVTVALQVALASSLDVTGSAGDDRLDLSTPFANPELPVLTIDGGKGADSIAAGKGADTLHGGDDDDTLDGQEGADALRGDAGNDLLILRNGDNADGGTQDDVLLVTGSLSLAATLEGGAGTDSLAVAGDAVLGAAVALSGLETLALGGGTLRLGGGQLAGFGTIAALDGATAATLELASAATATLEVNGFGTLTVLAAGGTDSLAFTQSGPAPTALLVLTGGGDDVVRTGAGADTLDGDRGRDDLDGGAGADLLVGGLARDSLDGGDGDDIVVGQAGNDRLRGGDGADRFRFEFPADGRDRIVDFSPGEDLIAISAAGFGGGLVAGQALTPDQLVVHASKLATADFGTGQFVYDTRKSMLLWDADGDGGAKAIKLAKLPDVAALDLSDIVILA